MQVQRLAVGPDPQGGSPVGSKIVWVHGWVYELAEGELKPGVTAPVPLYIPTGGL